MLWPVSDRALARADKSRLETGLSEFSTRDQVLSTGIVLSNLAGQFDVEQ